MISPRVAVRYAAALMAVAESDAQLGAIGGDLERIDETLRGSREFLLLLRSPVVSPAKKRAIFEEVFRGKLSAETATFLTFLVAKHREDHLPEIIVQFRILRDRREGTVPAQVVSAIELTGAQEQQLQRELETYTKKLVRLRRSVDPAIRAGMIVQLGDTVLDGSLRRQLQRLRDRLVEGAAVAA